MSNDHAKKGIVSEELRQKIESCCQALQISGDNPSAQLAEAAVTIFSIENESLPAFLRPDLLKAREAVLGNALAPDSNREIAEGQLRAALASLTQTEKMQVTYSLLAFCNLFDQIAN